MIHRPSRDRLALALRRYAARRLTNDDLDGTEVDWRDRGAIAVQQMAWRLYEDTCQHKAQGRHALDRQARRMIARWIVFLHSDREYLWPEYSFIGIVNWPMNLLTLGWWERRKQARWAQFLEAGEYEAWPFSSRQDVLHETARPRLLAGHGTPASAPIGQTRA